MDAIWNGILDSNENQLKLRNNDITILTYHCQEAKEYKQYDSLYIKTKIRNYSD